MKIGNGLSIVIAAGALWATSNTCAHPIPIIYMLILNSLTDNVNTYHNMILKIKQSKHGYNILYNYDDTYTPGCVCGWRSQYRFESCNPARYFTQQHLQNLCIYGLL